MQVLSTATVPEPERFAYWREILAQHFVHLRPERVGGGSFSSTIRAQEIAGHSLSEIDGGLQRVHRTRTEIARSPQEIVFLNLHVRGRTSYRQGGEEIAVVPGDLFIIDAASPFELGCEKPFVEISLKVPWHFLSARMRCADDARGAFISGTSYFGRLLGAYVMTQWWNGEARGGAVIDDLMSLAAYEIDRRRSDARLPRKAARAGIHALARRYIARHAGRADLAPREIAADAGVSLRTLQAIFAESGESIAHSIQTERLARAARELSDPERRHCNVAEIAFAAGFSELSHFTRAYARAYGEPPASWRRRKLDG